MTDMTGKMAPETTSSTQTPTVTTATELPDGITLPDGQTYNTEAFTESKTTGGWKVTYETVYTYIYNSDGSLYATHKDGPNEIERVQVFEQHSQLSADAAAIETNIQAEVIRVSTGFDYKRDIAASVLAGLNADRAKSGLSPLTMTYDSATDPRFRRCLYEWIHHRLCRYPLDFAFLYHC